MNEFTYDEIEASPEFSASFSVEITHEMMNDFKIITGDENPLHVEKEYALSLGYKDNVVYGLLTASFYSRLAGMYLPGKNCLLQRVDTHFHNPVFVGDVLTVTGSVKKKVELGHTLVISAFITNQDGVVVNTAKIEAGCTR